MQLKTVKKKITTAVLTAALLVSTLILSASGADNVVTDVTHGGVSNSTLQQWSNALTNNEQWVMMQYLENQPGWEKGYDIIAQSGWLYNPSTKKAFTYETERSLDKKMEYINYNDLAGVICWDAQGDNMHDWTMFTKMQNGLKEQGKEVIAYYGNWMAYGDSSEHTQGQWAEDLPWDQVTCINYAFFSLSNGQAVSLRNSGAIPKYHLVTLDEFVDFGWEHTANPSVNGWGGDSGFSDEKAGVGAKYGMGPAFDEYYHFDMLESVSEESEKHPDVRLMLSVGGWTKSEMFHEMCLTAANRKVFIDSCVEFLQDFPSFDGIDLDWEYPGVPRDPEDSIDQGNPAGPEDTANFTALLRELRTALDTAFPGEHKYLTTCTAADPNDKLIYFDAVGAQQYVDYMNIMTYDYTGTWETTLNGYNSPIYGEGDTTWCVDNSVKWFTDQGISPSKLNIGCPLYGYGFNNVAADANGNPVDLPNPIANGLRGNTMNIETGTPTDLDVVYTFFDGSERTPEQVHNPVTATVTSGSQFIDLQIDEQGYIDVVGLSQGTATLTVTDELDGFSATVTVNVIGEPEPFAFESLTAEKASENTFNITCNATGGRLSYKYCFYVTKSGKIYDKVLYTTNKNYTFTAVDPGTYTVSAYAFDGNNTKLVARTTFTAS
ncbi:MAG: hypothetical protein IJL87_04450 [Clostridia bacterium]|nr:hypothetical protein [Clostridia bacterium]